MKSKASLVAMLAIAAGTLLGAASGCELIANVDRSKIDTGGAGGTTASGGVGGTAGSTGATGGTGGTGGTTGGTGGVMCDPAKCPTPADECKIAVCVMEMCGEGNADNGTVAKTQIDGDCKKNVCMDGAVVSQNDDTDIENDNKTCTIDTCDAGTVKHDPNTLGTMCADDGGAVCDSTGKCVQCNTDPDCAGSAPKTVCDPTNICVLPHCSNGTKDSTETDVDCGGPDCGDCADGLGCSGANDCQSNNCVTMLCATATCVDGVINNMVLGESDVDCGGMCPDCGFNKNCNLNTDCKSGDCTTGKCAANCSDTEKDQDESDIDCGGVCSDCVNGKICNSKTDCQSNFCNPSKLCAACANDGDCAASEYCSSGVCVNDKVTGLACSAGTQCATNNCVDGFCCGSATCGTCESCGIAGSLGACTSVTGGPDADTCTGTQSCDATGVCKKVNGQTCPGGMNSECLNNHCVDGYCCDAACIGACSACNVAGLLGICSNVPSGQDDNFPANICNGVNSCDGTGNGAGACKKDVGQACAGNSDCVNGQCVDGYCCGSASCPTCQSCGITGSFGACTNIPANTVDNNPVGACTGTQTCNGAGVCKKAVGQSCPGGNTDCGNGQCVDGVCCATACAGLCQACIGAGGTCAPIPAGTDPADECSAAAPLNNCNGANACGLGATGAPCLPNAPAACVGDVTCPANGICP